jgi:hypothetical protein
MLTPREAFKVGFLTHCAKLGMHSSEIEEFAKTASALVKQGFLDRVMDAAGAAAKGVGGAIGGMSMPVLAGMLLAPPAIGAAAGYGLGRMTDIDDEDVDSIKQQELIDEYMRNAERLRHRNRNFRSLRRL